MIKSMTGYGKSALDLTGRKITIEIKTLNSKLLDLNLKIPSTFRDKEWEIRNMLMQRFDRGKIDFYILSESSGETLSYSVNQGLAKKYFDELNQLAIELSGKTPEDLFTYVLKIPEVVQTSRDEMTNQEWGILKSGIEDAINQTDIFRTGEGEVLEMEMRNRVENILNFLEDIEPFELNRIQQVREKLLRDFAKYSADFSNPVPDQNRFEQELIYYLEKLDITEEKVRLTKHCSFFKETLDEPVSQGKKLGFVTQEMGREINTIGSKASDADIQKLVVRMKDELEKIKEQLGNIL